jgi:hypothetical protein
MLHMLRRAIASQGFPDGSHIKFTGRESLALFAGERMVEVLFEHIGSSGFRFIVSPTALEWWETKSRKRLGPLSPIEQQSLQQKLQEFCRVRKYRCELKQ